MALSTTYGPTGNAVVNGLLGGAKWASNALTYGFPTSGAFYENPYGGGGVEPTTGFAPLNASMIAATREAYRQFQAVSGLVFTEMPETAGDHAIMRNAYSRSTNVQEPTLAWAYFPSETPSGGDAWYNNASGTDNVSAIRGNNDWATVLHEVGHALGLKHPHEVDGAFPAMPVAFDSGNFSVMSYKSFQGAANSTFTNETFGYTQTLMMLDIAAIQVMYGANYATNAGNSTYRWSETTGEMSVDGVGQGAPGANRVYMTTWDGGGTDTYDLSNYAGGVSVDLAPGGFSTFAAPQLAQLRAAGPIRAAGNVSNALLFGGDARSLIENATGGAGDDAIAGNDAANLLLGGGGNDTLRGLAGDDALVGGAGLDLLLGGLGNDVLAGGLDADALDGGDGTDAASYAGSTAGLIASLTNAGSNTGEAAGDTYVSIENLIGTAFDDVLIGDAGANRLEGGAGSDNLIGAAGADAMVGGLGDDYYYVDDAGDVVVESVNEGLDRVFATISYTISDDVEALFLQGAGVTGIGNAGDNTIIGNALDNVLSGGLGGDYLVDGGGADTMIGGAGDDLYFVSATGGAIIEAAGGGFDRIFSTVSIVMADNVEALILQGGAVYGIGNAGDNGILGNALANLLSGGAGADLLYGFAGADTFVFRQGFNNDTIGDYSAAQGDVLQIDPLLAGDFAAFQGSGAQVGNDAFYSFGGGATLTLLNTSAASITAANVVFA